MTERDVASEANDGERPLGDEWDAAFSRLLEGVSLEDLNVPTASGERRAKLTFGNLRQRVAEQLREKLSSEKLRREAIERLNRHFAEATGDVDAALEDFVAQLLSAFNGGGEVRRLPDPKDGRSRTWQVLSYRSPGRGDEREPVITVLLSMRGIDALDRGQPALECRVSTPRNPRLVDFTAGSDFRADLEDAICRAYQDILGTLRFAPATDSGIE
jgi:hypothetical protein